MSASAADPGATGDPTEQVTAEASEGALLQSVRIGFVVLRVATILLACAWAFGNWREIGPGNQAVVFRFGRIVRVAPSGLVAAWPRPIERVVVLPAGERQMQLMIKGGTPADYSIQMNGDGDDPAALNYGMPPTAPNAATLLTGDGEVMRLDASITWRISDAAAYVVAQDHVAAALRRLFLSASLALAAGHELDDFLAVRPERMNDPEAQDARARVRTELVDAVNARLARLAADGAPLGVEVTRADVTPLLPDAAKPSFDAVLDAAQRADEMLATERTQAALTLQNADRQRDRLVEDAHAAEAERISEANTATATIDALEKSMHGADRPVLLQELYRARIGAILRAAGRVDAIPPGDGARVLLPGPRP